MADRDMNKLIKRFKGKMPAQYDLTFDEILEISERFKKDPFQAICACFDFGFIVGARAERNGKAPRI